MRVLLIQTELNPANTRGVLHFGALAIATILKTHGHEVRYRQVDRCSLDEAAFLEEIERFAPGLIGFSVMTDEWFYVARLAAEIRARLDVPIVCGGAHATMAPEAVLSEPSIDIVCRGEGEQAVLDLCDCLENGRDYGDTANLCVRRGDEVVMNPVRPLVDDLDSLPFMDTTLLDFQSLIRDNGSVVRLMAGRGCPFDCTYCVNRGLHALYRGKGNAYRRRSPGNVIAELRQLIERYESIHGVGFGDDTFWLDKDWLKAFCALYTREIGLPFGFMMRAEYIDREFLRLVSDAGATWIYVGVECGNETLRREVLGRDMSDRQIVDAFRMMDDFRIKTTSLNMVGLPFETPATIEETLDLNRRLNPSRMFVAPFQPYPGTKLREVCLEHGWLQPDTPFVNRDTSILDLPGLPREEIGRQARRLAHIALEISVKKHPMGVYDFLAHVEEADVRQQGDEAVRVSQFDLFDDLLLLACPPSRTTYRLRVPEHVVLSFDIGMQEEFSRLPGDGALFIVEAVHGEGSARRDRLFARYINPRRNARDRGWLNVELPLERYGGREIELSFITKPGPAPDSSSRFVGWRRPCLTRISSGVACTRKGETRACVGA